MSLYSKVVKKLKKTIKNVLCNPVKFALSSDIKFNAHIDTVDAFSCFTLKDADMIKEMKAFLSLTSEKHCLLDVGALYGIFSLAFTAGNPREKIAYAIEPSPTPFRFLNYNLKFNPELTIVPFKIALGAREGNLKMKYEWQHLVAIGKDEKSSDYVNAKMSTLDKFLEHINRQPDVIKIDTEGYEFNVLKGGIQFLSAHDPLIFLEIHSLRLKQHGIFINQLVELVFSLGYRIYDARQNLIKDPIIALDNNVPSRVILSKMPLSI